MKLFVISIALWIALSNGIGQDYDMDRDYVPPAANQAGNLNTNPSSDASSLEEEMGQLEGELQAMESQINSMGNMNTNNNNNNGMGLPNTEIGLIPADNQQEQSNIPAETNNNNENNNQVTNSNSQPNVDLGLLPVSSIIDVEHVISHVAKHYKQNKFIIWIILGIAAFLALIACPSWVICCIVCLCHRRRQKARLQEKFSYDATSDSDEESGKPSSGSLVRKLTMVSKKRRHTQQRKGAYEPLKTAEDS